DRHFDYAYDVKKQLEAKGMRVELDDRNEKIGYKIREARLQKVPYMLVIGDSEVEAGAVAVRQRGENGDLGAMPLADFIDKAVEEIETKVIK
ncbi:MAG: threonine--tRNA ligase, partial [Clostridia bacterium]|nr:threonine--tRNA ligase [Clostridia bacterium]